MRARPGTIGCRLLLVALLLMGGAGASYASSGNSAKTCHDAENCSGMTCAEINTTCQSVAPGMCGCVIIK